MIPRISYVVVLVATLLHAAATPAHASASFAAVSSSSSAAASAAGQTLLSTLGRLWPFHRSKTPAGAVFLDSDSNSINEILHVGAFRLAWDAGRSVLTVTHESEPERVLWSTLPNVPFLSSAIGKDEYLPGSGNFDIKQTLTGRTQAQLVTSFKPCENSNNDCVSLEGSLLVTRSSISLNYVAEWTSVSGSDLRFSVRLVQPPQGYDRLFFTYALDKDEQIFGLGEQYTHVNLVGQKVPIIIREQGIGRGVQPLSSIISLIEPGSSGNALSTYTAIPHYISSKSRSVFLENEEVSIFDFTKSGVAEVQVISSAAYLHILHGRNPKAILETYTSNWSGRMPPIPEWLNSGGAIAGFQGGRARAEGIVAELKKRDIPVAAIWIQDWCGTREQKIGSEIQKRVWWNWEWDPVLYPDFPEFTANLFQQGIRTLVYVNPFLADVKNKITGFTRNFHDEADDLGHLVMKKNGQKFDIMAGPNFDAALVDLRDPEAIEWLKDVLKQSVLGVGVSGFMHDFGEWMPMSDDIAERNGVDAVKFHNKYAVEWARLTQEAIREAYTEDVNKDEIVFFTRSAGAKSPGFTRLFWAGDQLPTWDNKDGMKSAINGMLTIGLSGFSLTHSDIGGFTTVAGLPLVKVTRSRELLFRWMELAAFTAAYRTHEGSIPSANAQFYNDDETYRFFGNGAKIYTSLAEYRRRLMKEAYELGYPLMRFLWFEFPEDSATYSIDYQFMLGSDLLVAPVVDSGVNSVNVYLPAGVWIDSWTGAKIESKGQILKRNAPIGRPVTFIRGDQVPAYLAPFVDLLQTL